LVTTVCPPFSGAGVWFVRARVEEDFMPVESFLVRIVFVAQPGRLEHPFGMPGRLAEGLSFGSCVKRFLFSKHLL
jgi:hypothetical protein